MPIFPDPLHEDLASINLGFAPYGGGDVGEVLQLATEVTAGDDDSFFEAFSGLAQRLVAEADAVLAAGHTVAARDGYLRAAGFLGTACRVLYDTPVPSRLLEAFRTQQAVFERYLTLGTPSATPVDVPYEGTRIPAWLVPSPRFPDRVRPTILVGGGWDSTMVDNHIGIGIAALERGYHVVLHDGPGQGRLLFEEGLPLRHDWERVVTPVLDAALGLELVDPDRVVYEPWSLGGYMAPRVAAHEHRLAAIVADPGQLDVGVKVVDGLRLMGMTDEAVARLPEMDPTFVEGALEVIRSNRFLNWSLLRRGFLTNGAHDVPSFVTEMLKWKLSPEEVAAIRCPTLVTAAEGDRASTNSRQLYEALTCPKAWIEFTAAEGAGMHCETLNRSLANRRILDWLDDVLA